MIPCPACFAREVDPIPLHKDRTNGQLYCTKCTYVAQDAEQVRSFYHAFIRHRYGIERYEGLEAPPKPSN